MKGEAISLYPFYHFHPIQRHLDISFVITAESSLLRIAGNWNPLSTLALVAAVVRKMLKTRVTLGNISRVLLNLTEKLHICNVQRLLFPLNVYVVNNHIFSLLHQSLLLLTLTFVPLPYLFG